LIDHLVRMGADVFELGVYAYICQSAINEKSEVVTKVRNDLRNELGMTYDRLEKTLKALEKKYEVIQVLSWKKGRAIEIRVVPRSEYVPPPIFEEGDKVVVGKDDVRYSDFKKKVPDEYNSGDLLYYWSDRWRETFGIDYRWDWRKDTAIIKVQAMGRLGYSPKELVMIMDFIFKTNKGIIPFTGQRVYGVGVLASQPIMNSLAVEALRAKQIEEEEPYESPSVKAIKQKGKKNES